MTVKGQHVPMTVRHQQRRLRAYERFHINESLKKHEAYMKAKAVEKASLEKRLGGLITVKH